MNNCSSDKKLYLTHLVVLFLGWLLGMLAAYLFNLVEFDFSGEIQKARSLGIISITVLSGYPKSKDVLSYASTLIFPVLTSVGLWYFWMRDRRDRLITVLNGCNEVDTSKNIGWRICLFSVVIFYLFASFNINGFYKPGWNPYVRAWVFLGEDGENLAWVQSILSGGVYGKDFYCLYGPMLIYPLAWVMKLFGPSVQIERFYRYFLDLIAYGIIILFLYKTLRSKAIFVLSSIVFLLFFPPFATLSINVTYLRFVLGILPLFLIFSYFGNGRKYLLLLSGVFAAQSLLFSQEAGICSIVSVAVTFLIYSLSRHSWRVFENECILFLMGCLISAAPLLIYLFIKGAWMPFIDSLFGFPKLSVLGYGGLPAPALKNFIAHPLGKSLFFYWVIFLYVFTAIYLIPLLLIREIKRDNLLKMSVLVFGILLFMVAVRRYSPENVYKVFIPGVLLLFLFTDRAFMGIVNRRDFRRIGHMVFLILLFISAFGLVSRTGNLKHAIGTSLSLFKDKWNRVQLGDEIPFVDRSGIYFDPVTAESITRLNNFINANTAPGDYVYFFPNEAAYYFLFNRNNPTRYAISYFAITAEQRRELVNDLERHKPTYVVYSKGTWRVDDIPEFIQVPEVVNYIYQKYSPYLDTGNILIMKRGGL